MVTIAVAALLCELRIPPGRRGRDTVEISALRGWLGLLLVVGLVVGAPSAALAAFMYTTIDVPAASSTIAFASSWPRPTQWSPSSPPRAVIVWGAAASRVSGIVAS